MAFNALRAHAASAGERLSGARNRVQEQLQGNYANLQSLNTYVQDRSNVNVSYLKEAGYGIRDKAGVRWDQTKKDAEAKLFDLSGPVRAKVLFALKENVKNGLVADPDMFNCVKTRLEDLVDLFWDDLTISVEKAMEDAKQATQGKVETDVDALAQLGTPPCFLSPKWWRAQILYHLLPFDLSIFGNFKDPVWWVLTIFMCCPCFTFLPPPFQAIPIRVPFFVLYLILIVTGHPADEFQLVQYIMAIKGLQFLCSGILMMCYAAYLYYMCVNQDGTHSCDKTGPGAKQDLLVSITDWLGTCILVWVAFLWLPCSERSAGNRDFMEEEEDEEEASGSRCCGSKSYNKEKGGRLAGWLGYDFCCFLISCVLCYCLMCVDLAHLRPGGKPREAFPEPHKVFSKAVSEAHRWTGHAAIYWARIVYALLSAPFLLFWIPGLQGILTHTRITGYNRNGVCVPYMLHPPPDKEA